MISSLLLVASRLLAVLVPVTPAGAIRGGEPDTEHPSVGLVRFLRPPFDPNTRGWCTGTLIADRVVLTAAHCIVPPEGEGPRTDFFVTFSAKRLNNPLVDPSVADQYLSGTPYADPRFNYRDQGATKNQDRGVIVLDGSAKAKWGIDPVPLPPLGFMDGANHGTARGDTFTLVGYGFDLAGGPTDEPGKPTRDLHEERRFTTASLANTASAMFCLHNNEQSANAEGGGYFGDSGSTAFWEPWPYAFGTLSLGSIGTGCYARTDTVAAREFLGQFVALP